MQGEEYFNIKKAILDALENHNFSKHTIINYTPLELRDITDKAIIDNVKLNFIKNVASKLKINNKKLLEKEDKIIININISIKSDSNLFFKLNNKNRPKFIIPGFF